MTTIDLHIQPSPFLATPTRRPRWPRRTIQRIRRSLRPIEPFGTPSSRALDGIDEARSIQR